MSREACDESTRVTGTCALCAATSAIPRPCVRSWHVSNLGKRQERKKERKRKVTICPAPMTPRRFTSAAGLAAVELKCLTRLESRRACRAEVIEAAIVCGEDCELKRKRLENLEQSQSRKGGLEFGDEGGQAPAGAANLGPRRAAAVEWALCAIVCLTCDDCRDSTEHSALSQNDLLHTVICTVKFSLLSKWNASRCLLDFDASAQAPSSTHTSQSQLDSVADQVTTLTTAQLSACLVDPGIRMPEFPCTLRSP